MATQIMSIRAKIYTQSRPTRRNSRGTSSKWGQCMRYQKEISTPPPDQRCFYPTLMSSKFRNSTTPKPTGLKTSKTMAPRRLSTPSHLCRNHPRKTPWLSQTILTHAPASRPETPLFKRAREISRTSAPSARTTCSMGSTMSGCNKI